MDERGDKLLGGRKREDTMMRQHGLTFTRKPPLAAEVESLTRGEVHISTFKQQKQSQHRKTMRGRDAAELAELCKQSLTAFLLRQNLNK